MLVFVNLSTVVIIRGARGALFPPIGLLDQSWDPTSVSLVIVTMSKL